MESVESECCGDLADLIREAVEVGDVVGLRSPAGVFEHDHTEPLGQRRARNVSTSPPAPGR
jgi:hypothetical protein